MSTFITAIVVTFNRKRLLLKCLEAVISQSHVPDRVLIVDNASTDGTLQSLEAEGWLARENVQLLALSCNAGGAGGFASGIRRALELGTQWFWTMDDDGYPEEDCLELLLGAAQENGLQSVSPIHLDITDCSRLAFRTVGISGRELAKPPDTSCGRSVFIDNEANLFNGWLVASPLIARIGMPREELFIRGDEVEYTRRLRKAGVAFGTLADARFYHPSDRDERVRFLWNTGRARDAHNDFKNYYMYRNKALAFRENGQLWLVPLDFCRYCYYFLVYKKLDLAGFHLWLKATTDGLLGKLGRHPSY